LNFYVVLHFVDFLEQELAILLLDKHVDGVFLHFNLQNLGVDSVRPEKRNAIFKVENRNIAEWLLSKLLTSVLMFIINAHDVVLEEADQFFIVLQNVSLMLFILGRKLSDLVFLLVFFFFAHVNYQDIVFVVEIGASRLQGDTWFVKFFDVLGDVREAR